MRPRTLSAALLGVVLWLAAPGVEAWYRSSYHYGGYGGGDRHYNSWTGGSYHGGSGGYNPYTGREGASRSYYNPYTGNSAHAAAAYNPYTGRYAYHYSYSN